MPESTWFSLNTPGMKSNPLCLYATYPGLPTSTSLCVCLLSLCYLSRSPHPYLPLFAFCLYATYPGLPTPPSVCACLLCLPSVSMLPTQVSPPLPPSVCLLSDCHLPRSPHPYLPLFAFCLYATYPDLPTPTSLCLPSVSMPPTQVSPPLPPSVCLLSLCHLPRSPHPYLPLFAFCLYATYPDLPTLTSLCLPSVSMPPTQIPPPLPPSVLAFCVFLLSLCHLPRSPHPYLPLFAFCLYATYPDLPTPPSVCACFLCFPSVSMPPTQISPPLPPSVFAFRCHCAYRFFLLCPLGLGITQRLVVLWQAVRVWTHFVPLAASRLKEPVLCKKINKLSNEWKRSKIKL